MELQTADSTSCFRRVGPFAEGTLRTYSERRKARLMGGAATGLALLLASGGVAFAQETPAAEEPTEVEEVVVTGIRRGIENSISAKRTNSNIVEVVSAEDIGKLPDVSIAESLARLPGLTAQRLNGRAQVISVRGMSPDFTTALLNGREQVSTGDNRGVEFDQYPSELLSGVVVYKTPDAALLGAGLAGTADLRTVRPLAFGRQAIALNYRYEWNDIGALNAGTEDDGHRVTFSYIDQFMDGKLGVAIGISDMSTPYQAERFNAWGYPDAAPGAAVIGGAKPYVQSSVLDRTGYLAAIEYAPTDRFRTSLDLFYSQFDFTEYLRGIELPLFWSSATLAPGFTTSNGLVTQGTFNGVKGVVRNDVNTRDSELFSIGWNAKFDITDNWSGEFDLSQSKVERTDLILESYSGTGPSGSGATDSLGFRSGPSGTVFTPTLNYADYGTIVLTSPQGWGTDATNLPFGQAGYYNSPSIEDELTAIRLSATRSFEEGFLSDITFGVNLTSREKSFVADEYFMRLPGSVASMPIPAGVRLGTTSLAFLGIPGMVSYDPLALLNSGGYELVRNANFDVESKDWNVEEDVTTVFVKADIDTELASMPLTGNMGLQIVQTEQSSNAFAASNIGGTVFTVPVEGGTEYTEVLPSLNLIWQLPSEQFLRFSAARTLARPRMDQMRASFNFNYDTSKQASTDVNNSPWGGGGGNPELEPWMARQFDISYEKYWGRRAYVSIAAYYRDLETYVYTKNELYDFTGFPVGAGNPEPALRQGFISTPQNGEGGVIKGIEFAASVPFDMITPVLDGFGLFFSLSKTDSEIEPNGPGTGVTPLPGLSETVTNTTVYYEKNGFQARVSSRYRSDFLGEVAAFANGRDFRMVDEEAVVDAQIGYEFQSGPLEGLSILGQVNNLTDEEFSTYSNTEDRVIDYQAYGRTYSIGLNYKF